MDIRINNLDLARFDAAVARYPAARRALCFGDSWFQYVPHATDLNKRLARLFKQTLFLREGVAGRDSAMWKIALPCVRSMWPLSAQRSRLISSIPFARQSSRPFRWSQR